jgi:hypothetical protein
MAEGRLAETIQVVRSVRVRIIPRSLAAHCACFRPEANLGRCARLAIGPPSRLLI